MKNLDLVKKMYEGLIESAEGIGQRVIFSTNEFGEENNNENLYKELIKMFEDNGYTVYENGDIYAWNGGFETVNAEQYIAILDDYELAHKTIDNIKDYLLNKEFELSDLDNEAQDLINSETSMFDYDLKRDIFSDNKTGSCSYKIKNSDAEINIEFDVLEENKEDETETKVKVTDIVAL